MKLLSFILPFGRSRLVGSGNPPSIVIRASGCAAVRLFCLFSAFRAWCTDEALSGKPKCAAKPCFKVLLPLLLLLTLPAVVQAQFNFTTNNGAITITGYTGSGGDVTFPDATNGWPVTSIGVFAFSQTSLTSVTIPDSVTNIAYDAFYYCTSLLSVKLGKSITSIGNGAFMK